jgi:hypothetical protein
VVKALLAGGADVLIKDSVSTLKLVAVMKDIFFSSSSPSSSLFFKCRGVLCCVVFAPQNELIALDWAEGGEHAAVVALLRPATKAALALAAAAATAAAAAAVVIGATTQTADDAVAAPSVTGAAASETNTVATSADSTASVGSVDTLEDVEGEADTAAVTAAVEEEPVQPHNAFIETNLISEVCIVNLSFYCFGFTTELLY